jgi:hypothetical protein
MQLVYSASRVTISAVAVGMGVTPNSPTPAFDIMSPVHPPVHISRTINAANRAAVGIFILSHHGVGEAGD